MKKLGPDFRYGGDRVWAPTPVVSQEFAGSVSRAMFRPLNTATRIADVAADLRRYPVESHPAQFGYDD